MFPKSNFTRNNLASDPNINKVFATVLHPSFSKCPLTSQLLHCSLSKSFGKKKLRGKFRRVSLDLSRRERKF